MGDSLFINISRENDGKKAWYEWSFKIDRNPDMLSEKECSYGLIHNLGGAHSSILL
jgi:hypothetical protein